MRVNEFVRVGLSALAGPWAAGQSWLLGYGIRVLMYHRIRSTDTWDQLSVPPELFSEHLAYLNGEGYRVITLDEVLLLLEGKRPFEASARYVAVTFDDGWRDNYQEAFPRLVRHKTPATIFLVVRELDRAEEHPGSGEFLSWKEVHEMAGQGVGFGSHTLSHALLTQVEPQTAAWELSESKRILGERLGHDIKFFCYPKGDHNRAVLDLVRRAGYQAAFTVKPGANRPACEVFALNRTEITARDRIPEFKKKLQGVYDPLHRAWQCYRNLTGC